MRKLENFVPADHPLRPIRRMINIALAKMHVLFSSMYEADIKGARPSSYLETPVRHALEIIQQHPLGEPFVEANPVLFFSWLVGLATDDAAWVPTVFTKNRERLIEHDAVIELFNLVLEQAEHQGMLSSEYFSVDGILLSGYSILATYPFQRNDKS